MSTEEEERLIASVMPAVYKLLSINKYSIGSFDDALSDIILALVKATRTHDPKQGKFSTYAYKTVRGALADRKKSLNTKSLSKVSGVTRDFSVVMKSKDRLYNLNGIEPGIKDISLDTGLTETRVDAVFEWKKLGNLLSLDFKYPDLEDGDTGDTLGDKLPNKTNHRTEDRIDIETVLNKLNPRYRRILLKYVNGNTMREVAIEEKISECRVFQIINEAQNRCRSIAEGIGYKY